MLPNYMLTMENWTAFFRRQVFMHTPKPVKLTQRFYIFVYNMIQLITLNC